MAKRKRKKRFELKEITVTLDFVIVKITFKLF